MPLPDHFSRRQALAASGAALLAPLLAADLYTPADRERREAGTMPFDSPIPHPDVGTIPWVAARLIPALAGLRSGAPVASDLMDASRAVRLMAQQIDGLHIDLLTRHAASVLSPAKSDYSDSPLFSSTAAFLGSTIPGYDPARLKSLLQLDADSQIQVRRSLSQNGIAWHLHRAADVLKTGAKGIADSTALLQSRSLTRVPVIAHPTDFVAAGEAGGGILALCHRVLCAIINDRLSSILLSALTGAAVGLYASAACTEVAAVAITAMAALSEFPPAAGVAAGLGAYICAALSATPAGQFITYSICVTVAAEAVSWIGGQFGC